MERPTRMNVLPPRPLLLDVDLMSAQGRALQQSVAELYGPKIVEAATLARRMFLLRSPWAPGLRFVGAETKTLISSEDAGSMIPIGLSGSGERLEDAFVACVGEGIDRLSHIERPGDVSKVASLADAAEDIWPAAIETVERAAADQSLPKDMPLGWVIGKRLGPGLGPDESFEDAQKVLLPADWCLRRTSDQLGLRPLSALSVGVAAGPTFDWAASRAILELIERDAASLWWMGGRRGKAIPLNQPGMAETVRLSAALRQGASDREFWVLDITTDIGIPVVVALSCDRDGRRLAYGLASRLSIGEAMHAALLELCQTELAILLAEIKRTELGEGALPAAERLHLERGSSIDANRCALLHPDGVRLQRDGLKTEALEAEGRDAEGRETEATAKVELRAILGALSRSEIEMALVELTRPEFDIPVVRAVAPGLQLMPGGFLTDRLRRTTAEFGGGSGDTGGIPLIL
jgi:ribosomal protein S12 methylthiotransferase accessory factor